MKKIILKVKYEIKSELNLKNLSKIDFKQNIDFTKNLKVLYDNKEISLGSLFDVREDKFVKKKSELILYGLNKYCNFLGWKWKHGRIVVKSSIGSYLGSKMTGGSILVEGSAENFVGSELINGEILIKSNALDFVGAPLPGKKVGMQGGIIIIEGNVNDYLGLNMRRGIIYVNKDAGNFCCNNMIAGTVIVKRKVGDHFANGLKRGTIIIKKKILDKKNFLETTDSDSTFFNFLDNFLRVKFGLRGFKGKDKLKRFYGDLKNDGVGEILIFN